MAIGLPCATLVVVTTTVTAEAAGIGSMIALGTIIAAHFVFRRRALRKEGGVGRRSFEGASHGRIEDDGDREEGERGAAWEVKVISPRSTGEESEGEKDTNTLVDFDAEAQRQSRGSIIICSSSDELSKGEEEKEALLKT